GNTGNSGNPGSTDNNTTATSYKITKNTTNVDRGSYTVLVNNTNKSTAVKGDTVTVNATAKTGYKLDYVKATDANGDSVAMNGTTFTMPASNVTIDVYFVSSTSYRITQSYPKNGSFTTVVNGSTTDDAAPGQTVEVIVAPEDGYQLNNIVVMNSKNKNEEVPVVNKSFVMPNFDVTVKVDFLKLENPAGNAITTELIEGSGTFDVKINGSVVSAAKAGEVVYVDLKPSDGYVLKKIEVRPNQAGHESDTISVNRDNQFVMPHYPVKVKVYYTADEFNVRSTSTTNGSFVVYKSGDNTQASVSKVTAGTLLVVNPTADKDYAVNKITYTDKDGNAVELKANGSGAYVFPMPTRDTTVSVEFRKGNYGLSETFSNATFQKNGKTVTYASPGDEVTIVPKEIAGYEAVSATAKQGSTNIEVDDFEFIMPIGKVEVTVKYEKLTYDIDAEGSADGRIYFRLGSASGKEIDEAQVGDLIYIVSVPDEGYATSGFTVTDDDGNPVSVNVSTQIFTMPASDVSVSASYAEKSTSTGIG
ncbi:MAG: hypothetical protein IJ364_07570, partial [Oscillospiraceae bacterium]|nr:hypothetical protein [Oscillospiraceae bacterium]